MARGNQREMAREKAAKKQKEASKKKGANEKDGNKGMTLEQRKQRDADIMRLKQEKKAAAAQKQGNWHENTMRPFRRFFYTFNC